MFFSFQRQFVRPNLQAINRAIEKIKENSLQIDEILDDEDLVNDLKQANYSQLISHLGHDFIKKLIDYITIVPQNDDIRIGHKFPYISSEILASENSKIIDSFFEEKVYENTNINIAVKEGVNENENKEISELVEKVEEVKISKETNENETEIKDNSEIGVKNEGLELNPGQLSIEQIEFKDKVQEIVQEVENMNQNEQTNNEPDSHENFNITENEIKKINGSKVSGTNANEENRSNVKFELLDHLFEFLNNDNDLNYVLCGYFSKVFSNLLSHKISLLMNYIFVINKNSIENMIKHINRKSINEVILKIILSPNCEVLSSEIKTNLIVSILTRFNPSNEEESINITEFFLELLMNKNTHCLVLKSDKILNILHLIVQENISNGNISKDIIKILVKMNEVLLRELKGEATLAPLSNNYDSNFMFSNFLIDDENGKSDIDLINNQAIFKTLYDTFIIVLDDFMKDPNSNIIHTSFAQDGRILGIKKIAELDYIRDMIEIILNASSINLHNQYLDDISNKIITSGAFKKIFEFLVEFQWNNLYQRSFEQLVNLMINKFTSQKFINNFFYDSDLFSLILSNTLDPKFRYISGKEINNGLFALFCDISFMISKSENEYLVESLTHETFWKNYILKFIIPVREKFSQGMQFNQETPFQPTTYTSENKFVSNEALNDFYKLCKDDLLEKKFISNSEEVIHEKIENHHNQPLLESTIVSGDQEVYDNTYWKTEMQSVDFEIC